MSRTVDSSTNAAARFRDRIKELRRVPGAMLKRNPKNWRRHGDQQRAALQGILEEVGFAGAAVAFVAGGWRPDAPDEDLVLVDGHLRADVSDDELIPVLVTDLTPEEADKILASYDVLGLMADIDAGALEQLTGELDFDSHDLQAAIAAIVRDGQLEGVDNDDGDGKRKRDRREIIPAMELQPQEHYDYVVFVARTRTDWHRVMALLNLQHTRKPRSKWIGLGRAADAKMLLRMLDAAYERGIQDAEARRR